MAVLAETGNESQQGSIITMTVNNTYIINMESNSFGMAVDVLNDSSNYCADVSKEVLEDDPDVLTKFCS